MNELLDDDEAPLTPNDRELTLSTGSILGIFFGLVLLCGVCFGAGYNMGHKSAPVQLAINDAAETPAPDPLASKPPAGSPADTTQPAVVTPAPRPVRKPPVVAPAAEPATTTTPTPAPKPAPAPAPIVRTPPPTPVPAAALTGTDRIMVQVAAVSHQDDAELLVGALRARGYTVSARPSAGDNFIHVQVGPFSNKKDAEAMRQRLLADGYNALLKGQ